MADPGQVEAEGDFYCATRDVFQARYEKMIREMFSADIDGSYVVSAIAGEIGNNSFDHNIGNWPDVPGVFFCYDISDGKTKVVLADRGRGILETLKKIKPELENDEEALRTAFTEKISGRAPENRGNGLKFVRENVKNQKMHLTFFSGSAKAELNEEMKIGKNENDMRGCLAIIES